MSTLEADKMRGLRTMSGGDEIVGACEDRPVHLEATTLGELLNVRDARLVVIHDVWSGYNPASPIAAVYELHRTPGNGFSGEGRFSTRIAKPSEVAISMKSATATSFLDAIASAEIVAGEYEPFQDHTDDYPRIQIALHVGAIEDRGGGIAMLHTESQGEYHTPWAAFVAGASYVVKGDEIGRALRALDRSLKREELRRIGGE